ncbi:MAG: SIS domain-containing protein, partial [Clostridia bacterium]|nr:SIS domain-containing protein [Clostridia bacterium]
LALITKDSLVVNIITCQNIKEKSMNALHEVKTRGARVLLITCFEELLADTSIDDCILLPKLNEYIMPLISIIPIQLFSYYIARARGNDPDKPRNLAKSVTVE